MQRSICFVTCLLILATCVSAQADIFNVTNVTELEAALATAAGNGIDDDIHLAAGVYAPASTLLYVPSEPENYALTIQGAGPENTILDGTNSVQILAINTTGLLGDSISYINVQGITFQNSVEGAYYGGLYVETMEADITVSECVFKDNTSSYGGGAYLETEEGIVTVQHCVFDNNAAETGVGGGLFVDTDDYPVLVRNTLFNDNWAQEDGGGAYLYTLSSTIRVLSNTFTGNYARDDGAGVFLWMAWDPGSSAIIKNNISRGNSGDDIYIRDTRDDVAGYPIELRNNDYSVFSTECQSLGGCTPDITQSGNIDQDPLFATGPLGDYYLSQIASGEGVDSPCVDAGDDTVAHYGLQARTTRSDQTTDAGTIDMGYHYPVAVLPGLTQINLSSPTSGSTPSSAPTLSWTPDGGTGNVFVVDLHIPGLVPLWTTQIILQDSWTMPTPIWNLIPSASIVAWRVRGADLDAPPLNIITSDEIWWFQKL